jgi:hypothetical protein
MLFTSQMRANYPACQIYQYCPGDWKIYNFGLDNEELKNDIIQFHFSVQFPLQLVTIDYNTINDLNKKKNHKETDYIGKIYILFDYDADYKEINGYEKCDEENVVSFGSLDDMQNKLEYISKKCICAHIIGQYIGK